MSEDAITLTHLAKRFGRRPAVHDLSLAVPRGSVFGLLGHNGAGKSTTLGMTLGQVFPDRGEVRIEGHDVFADRAAALAHVGAIFEGPAFYDYLSAMRNLRIFCDYTARTSRKRIDEVVELVGLRDRIGHKVGTYSHGMRQRLAMAQALLPEPRILILDEPADGLDPQGIAELRQFLRRLQRELGLTIVFSSHQLHEVEQLCTHLAVMHGGRLVFSGTMEDAKLGGRYLDLEVDRRDEALGVLKAAGFVSGGEAGKPALSPRADAADANRLLVERGFRVSRIGVAGLSLEEFYLRLVQQPAEGGAEAA